MSFLFPERSYKNFINEKKLINQFYEQENTNVKEKQKIFSDACNSYFGLGWILSFIPLPFFSAYKARQEFVAAIEAFKKAVDKKKSDETTEVPPDSKSSKEEPKELKKSSTFFNPNSPQQNTTLENSRKVPEDNNSVISSNSSQFLAQPVQAPLNPFIENLKNLKVDNEKRRHFEKVITNLGNVDNQDEQKLLHYISALSCQVSQIIEQNKLKLAPTHIGQHFTKLENAPDFDQISTEKINNLDSRLLYPLDDSAILLNLSRIKYNCEMINKLIDKFKRKSCYHKYEAMYYRTSAAELAEKGQIFAYTEEQEQELKAILGDSYISFECGNEPGKMTKCLGNLN